MWLIESNFQWSVQSNAGLISFALLGFVFGPKFNSNSIQIQKLSIQILQRKLKPRLMSECFNLRQPVI